MIVRHLREQLSRLPADAPLYAYEGEETGIVVLDPKTGERLAFYPASERDADVSAVLRPGRDHS
jgi:hypothetical protein